MLEPMLLNPQVFTVAEHRRRHELTHTPTSIYICAHEGCMRKYKRAASLMRHQRQQYVTITPYRDELKIIIRDSTYEPPEENSPPLGINLEKSYLPSMNQLEGFSAQPPHTPSILILEAEDISGPDFGSGNSLGDLFQPKSLETWYHHLGYHEPSEGCDWIQR